MKMDGSIFRIIGLIYIVLTWFASALGVLYFFEGILVKRMICVDNVCVNDLKNTFVSAVGLLLCMLSAISVVFVKVAMEEGKPYYITLNRIFMLLRNHAIVAWLIYLIVTLRTIHFFVEFSHDVEKSQYTALILPAVVLVITCIELWILAGIQRYAEYKSCEIKSVDKS